MKKSYISYEQACRHLGALTLAERRDNLCLKFAKKNFKSEHSFFTKLETNLKRRNPSRIVKEPKCNTRRYQQSSTPYLARELNCNLSKTK